MGEVSYSATKEPETVEWINSFPQEIVFWDIGANCGSYSLYAALEKNCTVLAFEPSFSNYDALNTNIQLNSADKRIRAFCIAFHNEKSIKGLHMKKTKVGGAGSSFEKPVDHTGDQFAPYFVQGALGISIDDFIAEYNVDLPYAIKIDVDGNEELILNGATKTLKDNKVKLLQIELNDALPEYIHRVNNLLYESGFSFVKKTITSKKRISNGEYSLSSDQNHNYHFEKI